jgi:hypothetical protein
MQMMIKQCANEYLPQCVSDPTFSSALNTFDMCMINASPQPPQGL